MFIVLNNKFKTYSVSPKIIVTIIRTIFYLVSFFCFILLFVIFVTKAR